MNKDELFYLGKLTRTHGYGGRLLAFLDTDTPENYVALDTIFIRMQDDSIIPYRIQEFNIKGKKAIVRFEDVDGEQAVTLVNKSLYLPLDQLPELSGKKFYYHEVPGFLLQDMHGNIIGRLEEIVEAPSQDLIKTTYGKKEILIPILDHFIDEVNRKKKVIVLNLPDGFLDI